MAPLATPTDVEAILCREIPDGDLAFVTRLLDLASARVRRFTRQTLSFVEDDTATLEGTWGEELYLPQIPVTDIDSVVLDGVTLDPSEYSFTASGVITRIWRWWGGPRSTVVVTNSHGFDPIPDDIVAIVADLVAVQYRNPDQLQAETIGNYSVTYAGARRDEASVSIQISKDQREELRNYKIRQVQTTIDAPLRRPLQQLP